MSDYKYSIPSETKELSAKAVGTNMSISTKHAVEICNYVRHKNLLKVKELLEKVMKEEAPIPFKRFNKNVGHRKGNLTSGRYPVKASGEILSLLKSVESNAISKGMNASKLVIQHICAKQSFKAMHSGRHPGRKMKRTHVEVMVIEKKREVKQK